MQWEELRAVREARNLQIEEQKTQKLIDRIHCAVLRPSAAAFISVNCVIVS